MASINIVLALHIDEDYDDDKDDDYLHCIELKKNQPRY